MIEKITRCQLYYACHEEEFKDLCNFPTDIDCLGNTALMLYLSLLIWFLGTEGLNSINIKFWILETCLLSVQVKGHVVSVNDTDREGDGFPTSLKWFDISSVTMKGIRDACSTDIFKVVYLLWSPSGRLMVDWLIEWSTSGLLVVY